MATGLQFRGLENVLRAYNYKSVEAWSVFDGKNLMHKGWGEEELREFLTLICEGGSGVCYTLKVYEDIEDAKKIKSSSPDDGSFRFKLVDVESDPGYTYRTNSLGSVNDNLRLLNERLDKLEGPIDEDETFSESVGKAMQNAVIGAIENPEKIGAFVDAIKQLLGISVPRPAIGHISRAGAGYPLPNTGEKITAMGNEFEQTENAASYEDKINRLSACIDLLERFDPKIVEHLEKLAAMAQSNPKKFASLTAMLDLM